MSQQITDTLVLEVTGVKDVVHHPYGYGKPSERLTTILLTHNAGDYSAIRSASITIPGNLPIGTRFKVTIEQVDTVEAATIHRGALPVIDDSLQLKGGNDEIQ